MVSVVRLSSRNMKDPERVSWKTRYDQQRAALKAARHQIPQPAPVRALLASRLRTLPARARLATPEERERLFTTTSAAYSAREPTDVRSESTVIDGVRWHVPRPPDDATTAEWKELQFRFPYHAILQTREVSVGGLMLDIGANVGRMSIPRVIFGDAAGAYCAEPDPANYACLRRNVVENGLAGLVLPDQVAIGDHNGTVTLELSPKHTGHQVKPGAAPRAPSDRYIEVRSCTLDTWVSMHRIDLDAVTFIKVDVEGYEQRVLDGAAGVLRHTHIAWQLEVWARRLAAFGGGVSRLAETLGAHFTHFIDLRRSIAASRVRPIDDIHAVAAELERENGKTDIVVFHES